MSQLNLVLVFELTYAERFRSVLIRIAGAKVASC
jgi:hypothetical protein